MSEYNVVDALWFNKLGIVRVRPEVGEDKFYIGPCDYGASEEWDSQNIAAWGTPVHPEVLETFFSRRL